MQTPTVERPQPATPTRRRRFGLLATAAAAVVAVAVVGVITLGGGGDPAPTASEPLQLGIGQSDALASCLPVSAEILAPMPVAFEATATSVDGEAVTLSVVRWFAGGDAATVELVAPDGMEALIGGIDFVEGERYLVTATDGVVNYCGFTGLATPELTAIFEQAFGA